MNKYLMYRIYFAGLTVASALFYTLFCLTGIDYQTGLHSEDDIFMYLYPVIFIMALLAGVFISIEVFKNKKGSEINNELLLGLPENKEKTNILTAVSGIFSTVAGTIYLYNGVVQKNAIFNIIGIFLILSIFTLYRIMVINSGKQKSMYDKYILILPEIFGIVWVIKEFRADSLNPLLFSYIIGLSAAVGILLLLYFYVSLYFERKPGKLMLFGLLFCEASCLICITGDTAKLIYLLLKPDEYLITDNYLLFIADVLITSAGYILSLLFIRSFYKKRSAVENDI